MTSSWDLEGPPEAPAAVRRARRRPPAWAIAVVVAVIVVGGAVVWGLSSRGPDAREVAERYVAALRDGDVAGLRAVTGASVEDPAIQAFAQADGYLDGLTLEAVETADDRGTLRATVAVDGEEHTIESPMERTDGVWRVGDLVSVTVTPSIGDAFAIGSLTFPSGETLRLYPARYEATSLPAEILDGAATITPLPGADPAAVTIEQTFRDDARDAVQERVDAHVADCAAATDAIPEACGIVVPWPADLRELRQVAITLDRVPQVEIDTEQMTFAATGGAMTATVSGLAHDGSEQTFTYRADEWSLRGTMGFAGGQLVLSVF